MSSESFVYWLQGYFEIADPKSLGEKEIQIIKDHLALVLKKETPNRNESKSKDMEDFLKRMSEPTIHPTKLPGLGPITC